MGVIGYLDRSSTVFLADFQQSIKLNHPAQERQSGKERDLAKKSLYFDLS